MQKIILLIICCCLFISTIISQNKLESGYPLVNNYSPKKYGADTQNWAILQDDRGIMYFGNNLGLLEFDGADWKLYPLPNNSLVRSLAKGENGKIYAGGKGDLGYYLFDSEGRLTFHSLLPFVPEDKKDFSDVWQSFVSNGKVYFNTAKYILIWDIQKEEFKFVQGDDNFHLMGEVNGTIYVRQWGKGLLVLENETLVLVKGGEKFANERIYVMLPFPDEDGTSLIVTRTMGLIKYDGKNFIPFKTEVDELIKENLIYSPGAILYDGNILLGTLNDGAVVIDRHGKEVRKYNHESGIISTVIYFTFQDQSGAIWLSTDNGISRIDYASQVSYFDSRNNFSTTAYQIIRHKGTIYVATNSGIYFLDQLTLDFHQLKNSINQSWALLESGDELLAGTFDGLFKVDKNFLTPIRKSVGNEYHVHAFKQSESNPSRIYICATGLWSLFKNKNGWLDEGVILDIEDIVNSIEEEKNGTLWIGTDASGVYRITPQKDVKGDIILDEPFIENFDNKNGLPDGILYIKKLNGKNYFLSSENFYRFDESKNSFYLDNTYNNISSLANYISPNTIKEDNLRRLWISLGREPALGTPQPDGRYKWLTAPFRRFSNEIIVSIYPEDNGVVWFSSSSSIIKYDLTKNNFYNSDYSALVRRVEIGADSAIYFGGKLEKPSIPKIEFEDNSIKFTFAAPSYEDETANQYKTFLEGFDEDWSTFVKENKKEYTYLSPGSYTFNVIAKNVFEIESKEASYSFEILAPWYRTWAAYFIYVLLLAGGIFLADRVQRRRLLHKAKERMKIQEVEHRAEAAELQAKVSEAQSRVVQAENERKTNELSVAASIQQRILPTELPKIEGYDLAGTNIPSKEVGGDYYDCLDLGNGKYALIIADVAGKGIGAALLVSSLNASLYSYLEFDIPLTKMSDRLNKLIYKSSPSDKFITFFIAVLDSNSGELDIVNAGHNPIFLLRKDGKLEKIDAGGVGLGMFDFGIPYNGQKSIMNSGDKLFLYTDGIPEAMNENEEEYSDERMINFFLNHSPSSAKDFIDALVKDVKEYSGTALQSDDITTLILKRN